MTNTVDYYFSVASPWAYLGSARFIEITRRYRVGVTVMPVELSRIFAASGGTAFTERASQRQHYRQLELARWSRRLRIPLTLEPRFYPVDRRPASYLLIAAREAGIILAFAGDVIGDEHAARSDRRSRVPAGDRQAPQDFGSVGGEFLDEPGLFEDAVAVWPHPLGPVVGTNGGEAGEEE